jgi:hypothetical protein
VLFVPKFVSWVIALGSGTSGGTLAPLFTIGGGLGGVPVVARENPRTVIGWLTRSDLLTAHRQRLEDASRAERALEIRTIRLDRGPAATS